MGQAEEEGVTPRSNADVARCFEEMAALLELQESEPFRLRAYQRAAQSIRDHPEPLADLLARGELRTVRGIGEAFALKVTEILRTGTCPLLDRLRAEVPAGLLELTRVPGVGPKTAALVWRELKLADLGGLEQAARDGRLAGLRGLGQKRAAAILTGIAAVRRWRERTPVAVAWPVAEALLGEIRAHPGVLRAEAAGSLRRGRETIGDLDVVVSTSEGGGGGGGGAGAEVLATLAKLPMVTEVLALGETKASLRTALVGQVDVRAVSAAEFPAAWQYFTGSKEHNVRLRELAKSRGFKLNEYGLFPAAGGPALALADEAAIYGALGLAYIPPELREDSGEIEAASAGGAGLPRLVERSDLRGDLHVHSSWSDGRDTIAELAAAAAEAGYEYLAVTDHSRSLAFVRGLGPERLAEQAAEIAALGGGALPGRPMARVLRGCEVEILPQGELDLPDEALGQLDFVVAAVHNPVRRDGLDLTERLVRAMRHPLVDVVAHPTGRLIGERDAYAVDMAALIAAAAETGVALEINASPQRLDLPAEHARRAAAAGVKLAISTDAHDRRSLAADIGFGVRTARRAWLRREDVLNCLPLEELLAWRRRRIEARRGGAPGR